ncbi:MAG: TolC family protein [Helicobacteraceae bacterium]|nr:TolC family protein [Helicobacteraceae bacterium]
MKQILMVSLLSLSVWGASLSTLIEQAQNNELVEMYQQKLNASDKTYKSVNSSYYPSVDLGAMAQLTSPKGPMDAGQVYNANIEASLVLLDGFKRENILDEKSSLKRSSGYELSQIKKQVSMEVATHYFNLKTIQADIAALHQKKRAASRAA